MLPPIPFRVRFILVGILSVLTLGLALPDGKAQFGRPPGGIGARPPIGFGGGIAGRPAGFSGISGMPGGIAGRPGGITGISGMPHGIGGGGITFIYRCSRCGYTQNTPGFCPICAGRGNAAAGSGAGLFSSPSSPPAYSPPASSPPPTINNPTFPASTSSPTELPPLAPNPNASGGVADKRTDPSTTSTTSGSGDGSSSSSSSSDSGDSGRTWKIVGLVVASVFFLLIVAMLIVVVSNSSAGRPVRHRRRARPLSRDDDD